MGQNAQVWLAAYYHMAVLYSCLEAMSSPFAGKALPTPGPATVLLALLRTSIERFGPKYTQEKVFPLVRNLEIRVRPPRSLAISNQVLRMYKVANQQTNESLAYREYIHAQGPMCVYLLVDAATCQLWEELLPAIGYWGQANNFVTCLSVQQEAPLPGSCAQPFATLSRTQSVRRYYASYVTEFRSADVSWNQVVHGIGQSFLVQQLYVWPLELSEQGSSGRRYVYRSIE